MASSSPRQVFGTVKVSRRVRSLHSKTFTWRYAIVLTESGWPSEWIQVLMILIVAIPESRKPHFRWLSVNKSHLEWLGVLWRPTKSIPSPAPSQTLFFLWCIQMVSTLPFPIGPANKLSTRQGNPLWRWWSKKVSKWEFQWKFGHQATLRLKTITALWAIFMASGPAAICLIFNSWIPNWSFCRFLWPYFMLMGFA